MLNTTASLSVDRVRVKKSYLLIFLSFLEAGNRSVLEKSATIYDYIAFLDSGTSWLLETSNSDKCISSTLVRNH